MTDTALDARPLVPVPDQWTFWADTIIGAVALGPVEVSAFSCTSKLSDFGSGQVTVSLPCGLPSDRLLRLWSWRLWCFYGGLPYWCGVPTGITDDGSTQVTLTLAELPGYLAKRQYDYYPNKVWTQTEQTAIAADIASPLSAVGVPVAVIAGAGVKRDRTYEYLEGDSRAALLTNLSQVQGGPEFRAEYAMTPAGLPQCTLRITYPRVGSGSAGLAVAVGGDARAYQAAWDADQLRTWSFAVGDVAANAPSGTLRPVVINDTYPADLPRLDEVDDWTGTILSSTLTERALTAGAQYASPTLGMQVTPSEALPPITSYGPGDDVTVRATTPLIPAGITVTGRLTQVDVDAGAGTAAWTIATTLPPPRPRETLAGRLTRYDAMLTGLHHLGPK